jgi:hypothetical protein
MERSHVRSSRWSRSRSGRGVVCARLHPSARSRRRSDRARDSSNVCRLPARRRFVPARAAHVISCPVARRIAPGICRCRTWTPVHDLAAAHLGSRGDSCRRHRRRAIAVLVARQPFRRVLCRRKVEARRHPRRRCRPSCRRGRLHPIARYLGKRWDDPHRDERRRQHLQRSSRRWPARVDRHAGSREGRGADRLALVPA